MPIIAIPYQFHATGLLPLCEVVILGKNRRVVVRAVIDSGATHPFFPRSVAEDAGLSIDKAKPMEVIFGGSTTIGHILECFVEIKGRRLRVEIVFVDDIKLGYALFGRRTVFNQFNEVAFIERIANPRIELRS